MKERSEKNYKALALMPMLLFLVLYVGCGIVFTIMGKSSPFSIMSRYTAILITIMVALLCYDTKTSVNDKLEVFCRGYGSQGVGLLAIIISAPIAKELGGKYKIAPKRLASLLDIFACAALMLVPHDSAVLLVSQYGGASYGEIIRWQFYPVLLLLFTVCTIQFGLLRTKDEKNASV
ncbi:MAG: hypothetical protein LUD07_01005 [Clostridiales bacterium]|nr:hypothetical protein [Clostridiales bacterium]